MAINRTSLSAQSITTAQDSIVIEMRENEPNIFRDLDPPQPPGKLIGYYNGASGFVELYVVSSNGLRLMPV